MTGRIEAISGVPSAYLNCPAALNAMMQSNDASKITRIIQTFLKGKKDDIAVLKKHILNKQKGNSCETKKAAKT